MIRKLQLALNTAFTVALLIGATSWPAVDRNRPADLETQLHDLREHLANSRHLAPGSAEYEAALAAGEEFIRSTQPGSLVFSHARGNPIAEGIRWLSWSPGRRPAPSHVYVGLGAGLLAEASQEGVVQTRAVDAYLTASELWVREVPGITAEQRQAVADFAIAQIGKPYNFTGLFFGAGGGGGSWYCSELVIEALRQAGVDIQPASDLTLQSVVSTYALLPQPLATIAVFLSPVMDTVQTSPQELAYATVDGRPLEDSFLLSRHPLPGGLAAAPPILALTFATAVSITRVVTYVLGLVRSLTMKQPTSRERLLAEIKSHLARGQSVLLLGERGTGKSWLLGRIAQASERAFYIPQVGAKKAVLLQICKRLWHDGRLEEFAYFADWADVDARLRRLTLDELRAVVEPHLADYLVVLDNLELCSEKAILEIVEPLMQATVLAAADVSTRSREKRLAAIANRFIQIEVPPMDKAEVLTMLWDLLDKDEYPHWQAIETKVLSLAQGRPGVVADLAEQLRGSTGSLAEVRALSHSVAEQQRVSLLLPLALCLIAAVFAGRYLARGFDDPTFYILAGLGSAASIALRPLLWRAA